MNLHVVTAAFCLLLAISAPTGAATEQGAGEVVKHTIDAVLERLAADKQALASHPERVYDLVDELVIPRFDFVSMSRWVLGSSTWKKASETQRQVFAGQFKTLLMRTYAKALLEYSDEEIKYLDAVSRENSRLVTVKTEMQGSGGPVPLDYRLHISGGEWKIVDVSVDRISLIATYRGSFRSEIKKNGLDALIARLVERNEKLAGALSTE